MGSGVIVLNQPDLSALTEAGEITKEASEKLSEIVDKLTELLQGDSLGALSEFLDELRGMMSDSTLESLMDMVKALVKNPNISAIGKQRVKGQYLQIPAVTGTYEMTWLFETDVYLTGLRYSQSAWKYQDYWTLEMAAGEVLFDTVFTKEVGEYKHFNRYEFVPAKTAITFSLFNNSGNSRDLWVDLEYLVVEPTPPPVDPDASSSSETIYIELWDNSAEDNDTIDVYLNNVLVVEGFVAVNAHQTVEVEGLQEGDNKLRFEGRNSDLALISISALIYEEDGTTPILNSKTGGEEFVINIDVPVTGQQSQPYPFLEWDIYYAVE